MSVWNNSGLEDDLLRSWNGSFLGNTLVFVAFQEFRNLFPDISGISLAKYQNLLMPVPEGFLEWFRATSFSKVNQSFPVKNFQKILWKSIQWYLEEHPTY